MHSDFVLKSMFSKRHAVSPRSSHLAHGWKKKNKSGAHDGRPAIVREFCPARFVVAQDHGSSSGKGGQPGNGLRGDGAKEMLSLYANRFEAPCRVTEWWRARRVAWSHTHWHTYLTCTPTWHKKLMPTCATAISEYWTSLCGSEYFPMWLCGLNLWLRCGWHEAAHFKFPRVCAVFASPLCVGHASSPDSLRFPLDLSSYPSHWTSNRSQLGRARQS